jgi:CHAD domain-containing protein
VGNYSLGGQDTEPWNRLLAEVHDKMNHYLGKAFSFQDLEDLHQARVNSRKLLTLINALAPEKNDKLMPKLKKAQRLLGRVRDCDVLIENFKKQKETLQDKAKKKLVKKFILLQKNERKDYRKKMRKNLPKLLDKKFEKQWESLIQMKRPEKTGQNRLLQYFTKQEKRFDEERTHYEHLRQNLGLTAYDTLKALHSVRLTAKELRYLLMHMEFVIEFDWKTKQQYYKDLQTQLGDINDFRVWIEKWEEASPQKLNVDPKLHRNQIDEMTSMLRHALSQLQFSKPTLM